MNDNEIKLRIAKAKGYVWGANGRIPMRPSDYYKVGKTAAGQSIWDYFQMQETPGDNPDLSGLPRWTEDISLAWGDLVDEMMQEVFEVVVGQNHADGAYCRVVPADGKVIIESADTPEMAICLAYLAWVESKANPLS